MDWPLETLVDMAQSSAQACSLDKCDNDCMGLTGFPLPSFVCVQCLINSRHSVNELHPHWIE